VNRPLPDATIDHSEIVGTITDHIRLK
jgi:hypothetical protein